jgi:hypothetical protein
MRTSHGPSGTTVAITVTVQINSAVLADLDFVARKTFVERAAESASLQAQTHVECALDTMAAATAVAALDGFARAQPPTL